MIESGENRGIYSCLQAFRRQLVKTINIVIVRNMFWPRVFDNYCTSITRRIECVLFLNEGKSVSMGTWRHEAWVHFHDNRRKLDKASLYQLARISILPTLSLKRGFVVCGPQGIWLHGEFVSNHAFFFPLHLFKDSNKVRFCIISSVLLVKVKRFPYCIGIYVNKIILHLFISLYIIHGVSNMFLQTWVRGNPHSKLTTWLMEPGGSMPHSQGFSNNPYPEPNRPSSSYLNLFLLDPF